MIGQRELAMKDTEHVGHEIKFQSILDMRLKKIQN